MNRAIKSELNQAKIPGIETQDKQIRVKVSIIELSVALGLLSHLCLEDENDSAENATIAGKSTPIQSNKRSKENGA